MAREIYLMSGHTSKGDLELIDEFIINQNDIKNLLVLDLSEKDEKRVKKNAFFNNYFKDMGAENIRFVSDHLHSQSLTEQFDSADMIYLPGGDKKLFIQSLESSKLIKSVHSFNGVISANSAGAYALSRSYFDLNQDPPGEYNGTGLVPLAVKCHYEPSMDSKLKNLSHKDTIFAISNGSALILKEDKIAYVKELCMFSEGLKLNIK